MIEQEEEIPTEAVDFDEYLDDFGDVVYDDDAELIAKLAVVAAPHMRDKESTEGILNFFDKLFQPKLNCPYKIGEIIEYFSRADRNNPRWRDAKVLKLLKWAEWNNNTPQEIEIILLDTGSTRIIRKQDFDKRLRIRK